MFLSLVGFLYSLLQQSSASPANWKAKDAAVYLVIALTIRGTTAKLGATQTNALDDSTSLPEPPLKLFPEEAP